MNKQLMVLMSLLLVLLFSPLYDADLTGQWSNQSGSFQFSADGQARIQWANGNGVSGQWQLNGQQLLIQTTQGLMQFQVQLQNDTLLLADQQGYYQFIRQLSSSQLSQSSSPAQSQISAGAGLTDQEYVHFLEQYPQQPADAIYRQLQQMSREQLMNFDIWSALGSDIYTRLCKGGYHQIIWQGSSSGPVGCQQLLLWEQQAQQYDGSQQEAEFQRAQVINMMKCSTGEHARSTCQAYNKTLQGYHDGTNKTMKTINKGFEPPPCTQYYDQNNVYLGCW